MIQHDDYVEFDLKSLCFHILRQWKTVLLWGLVFAILMGGLQTYSVHSNAQKATAEASAESAETIDPEKAQHNYTQEYQEYLEDLRLLDQRISYAQHCADTFEEYVENSVLMKIDYQKTNTAKVTYYIEYDYASQAESSSQGPEKTGALTWFYYDHLENGDIYEDIAAAVEMDCKYLPELVTVATPNSCTLTISVSHTSAKSAVQIMDLLQEQVTIFHKQLTQTVGKHTVTCVADTIGEYVDLPLHLSQNDTRNHLVNLQNNLLFYQYELRDLEEPELPKSVSVNINITPDPTDSLVKVFVKWAVLGGIVGMVLAVAYLFAKSLIRNRVLSASQLTNVFQTTVLGEAVCSSEALPALTRKINALEGCLVENSDGNYRFLAENIRNHCGSAKNILLCSDWDHSLGSTLALSLNKYLSDIQLLPAGSLLKDADALHSLTQCDAVVLIASQDISRNADIRKLLEQIRDCHKELIGFIVAY